MASRTGAKRLLISHFRIHMDTEEGHASALADLRQHFEGPAEVVEDLQVFDV